MYCAAAQLPGGFTVFPVDGGIPMILSTKLIPPLRRSRLGRLYYMGQDRSIGIQRLTAHLSRGGMTTKFVQSQPDGTIILVVAPIKEVGGGTSPLPN